MTYGDYSELIGRAQKGDTEAMAQLYSVSYNKVYFYAFKMFGNTDDACDIVQDVFVIVFTKIKDLREPAAYMSWISQITVNACKQKIRKDRKVMIQEETDELIDNIADDDISVEDIVADRDMRNFMMQIIDILPEEQKRSVLLYYYERLTIAQIAEIEGVSDSSIKSRLFYAREKMKKAIRFQEKKSGVRMFAFGAPALAVVLAENAAEFALPVPVAREIFFAVMAVIGIRNTDHRPAISVIGSSGENAGRGFFGKMKDGMVIAVHPGQAICVAIVIVALVSGAAVYSITHFSDNTKPSGGDNSSNISEYGASENRAEKGMPVSDTGSGMLTFSKKDVPDAIRNDIAYYSTQFYDGKVVLNPVMAYVRSTGANVYGPATMYKVTDNMNMNWYGRATNIVTFFDKNKKMIAYGFAYATDPPKTPKMIMVYYAFGLDEKAIEARVRIDVESQIKDLPELNESDFKYVYYKEKKLYTLTLTDSAIKKYGNSFTSSSNYWSSDSKQKRTNEIKSLMADMWIGENKIIGEDTSIKRLGKICTYHGGEFALKNPGFKYNTIIFYNGHKAAAIAYLEDSKIQRPADMPDMSE